MRIDFKLICVLIILGVIFLSYKYVLFRKCYELENIEMNHSLLESLWDDISKLLKNSEPIKNYGLDEGVMFAEKVRGNFGIDWKHLGIPLKSAALEVRGQNLNYKSFDPLLVEEVRIGYGYRKQLVFKVDKSANSIQDKVEGLFEWSFETSVICMP